MTVTPKVESFFQTFLWVVEWLVSKKNNSKARIRLLEPIYAKKTQPSNRGDFKEKVISSNQADQRNKILSNKQIEKSIIFISCIN